MRVLQVSDFEKLARDVVSAYTDNSVPLENSVVKISSDMGLNPDQIQNLVQLSNTLAHLSLFDKKDDSDKVVDFSPADPDSVMKQVYATSERPNVDLPDDGDAVCDSGDGNGNGQDSASDFFGDFPDLMGTLKRQLDGVPGVDDGVGEGVPSMDTRPKHAAATLSTMKKVASEINDRKQAAAYDYKEELDKLASSFAHLYGPDHTKFEKSAMLARGQVASPILSDIRGCLKMPLSVPAYLEKSASCIVDTDSPEFKLLDSLIKFASVYNDCEEALSYLHKETGGVL